MKVATSVANITPKNEVYLCGYVGEERKHPAKGVHDDPLAVSLLIEIKDIKLLFISIDVIMISASKADFIKDRICEILPLKKENIIINAIHSHSLANGFTDEILFGTPDNPEYFQYACSQIIASVQDLNQKLETVRIEIGTTKVHGYYSKRSDKTLPFEDNALLIKFLKEDQVIASICNFNTHATVLGPKNMMLSSDIIGAVRSHMAQELGVVPYTITGASGDISNRQYRQGNDFQELERVAKGIYDNLKDIDNYSEVKIDSVKMSEYDYHIAYDNTAYYEEYQKGIDEANEVLMKKNISPDEWKLRTSEKTILENKMNIKEVDFHVKGKVLTLSDLTIVTFPGELASKFGLYLRSLSPTKYFMIIGYADDYEGYFIEAEEYGKTYETKASNTPKGESEKMVHKIGELL